MGESGNGKIIVQKCKELSQAINGFLEALKVDINHFDNLIEQDLIRNGQIQKFEYSLELTWKFIKFYLYVEKGIDAQGPKDVIREFAKLNFFSAEEIQLFLAMVDDRNRIAHEYKDYIMENIYPRLTTYSQILARIDSIFTIYSKN
jgi:nucleotidyltransferase substrate binding protein (TIGR01987 family)